MGVNAPQLKPPTQYIIIFIYEARDLQMSMQNEAPTQGPPHQEETQVKLPSINNVINGANAMTVGPLAMQSAQQQQDASSAQHQSNGTHMRSDGTQGAAGTSSTTKPGDASRKRSSPAIATRSKAARRPCRRCAI